LPVHRGNPKAHEAISFPPGAVGSDKTYGHVGVVEVVNPDGSILVSETNAGGGLNGKRTWRIISATDVLQCYYIDYS
jgi:surface antigen